MTLQKIFIPWLNEATQEGKTSTKSKQKESETSPCWLWAVPQNPQAKQADRYKGPTTGECRLHDYGFSLLSPCEWYMLMGVASFSKFLTMQDFHLHCFLAHLNRVPCQCCECFSQFLARSWNQLDSSQETDCQIPCVHGLILAQLPIIGRVCALTKRMGWGPIKLEISKLAM